MLRLFILTFLLFVLVERGTAIYAKIGILTHTGPGHSGDIYIGTVKGVYRKYVGTHDFNKINDIFEPVATVNVDFDNGVYVTTSKGKLSYINAYGMNIGELDYIKDKVLSIGILKKKYGGSREAGDIYIGTTNGVYLKHVYRQECKKIDGINEAIVAINIDYDGGAYLTSSNGKLYYIDENGDYIKGLQSNIPDKILSIGILEKGHYTSGKRNAGDIYIATAKGVYLKLLGTRDFKKVVGINEPITAITPDFDGGAVLTTSAGKLYYINSNGDSQGVQNYIPDKVLTVSCCKASVARSRKAGDWYIGTNKGLYLKYVGTHDIKKVNGINEPVVEVEFDYDNGAYAVTQNGKFYYIDINGNNTQGVQNYIPDKIL